MPNATKRKQRPGIGEGRGRKDSFYKILILTWSLLRTRRSMFLTGLLLLFINRASGLVIPATTRFIIDDIIGHREVQKLPRIIAILLATAAVQAFSALGTAQVLSKGGQRIVGEFRMKVQAHVGLLPLSFHDATRSGELVSRIMSDVEGIRNLLGTGIADFLGSLTTAMLAFAMLVRISPRLALLASVCVCAFVFSFRGLLKRLWPIYAERGQAVSEVVGRLNESLSGIRVVKAFDAENFEAEQFAGGIRKVVGILMLAIETESRLTLLSQLTTSLLAIGVVYVGVQMVLSGGLTLGGYLTCNLLLAYILTPLATAVTAGLQLTEAGVGVQRALSILDQEREQDNAKRSVELGQIRGRVSFDSVSFAYTEGKPVLHEVSFVAEPNQMIALIGPSGAGKSTIANLICGFHTAQNGQVAVDGIDLKTVTLRSYRRQLGVVSQDTFLFHGTIRENVAFAKPDATEDQIMAVCHDAYVSEFADRFPGKYDTVVGERGVRLSGGQKQRVSIARALLANPRVLILDEATSNLDLESEQLIQVALANLMRGRTTLVIAHRLSTIRHADQILVLEAGRIVERGTHESLYTAGARYRSLHDRQFPQLAN